MLASTQRVGATTLTITNLGTLGGTGSVAYAMNSVGAVAGWSYTADGFLHGVLWSEGEMIDLGAFEDFYSYSEARDVNDLNQVVGISLINPPGECGGGRNRAFLWQDGGPLIDLGTLGGCDSGAMAINNQGWIIGFSTTTEGQLHGALWVDGQIRDLGTLGGTYSSALGINEAGQVVGLSETATGEFHAFLWTRGKMKDLGSLGGLSEAHSINNRGQVVGLYVAADGYTRAFSWSKGRMTDIWKLGIASSATSVNDAGDIVGTWYDAEGRRHSFLRRGDRMLNLEDLLPPDSGWSQLGAQSIGNDGRIVGDGTIDEGFRAFLIS
jgi:probable HAF family extracellular repeat protein